MNPLKKKNNMIISVDVERQLTKIQRSFKVQMFIKMETEEGFPGGSVAKEPTCPCRKCRRCTFDPWIGKISWRKKWQPIPIALPGKFHGQQSRVGYSPQGCKEVDMTEWLSMNRNRGTSSTWWRTSIKNPQLTSYLVARNWKERMSLQLLLNFIWKSLLV